MQECYSSIEQQIQDLLFACGITIEPTRMDVSDWCALLVQRAQPYVLAHAVKFLIRQRLKEMVWV